KTTTSAMVALTLIEAGLDPTVVVGSKITQLNSNARLGKSNIMVVEACEHQAHMLQLKPTHVIVTNIEEDHLDYYNDLDHIVMTFQRYINSLGSEGVFIKNNDDSESAELGCDGKVVTFGIESAADVKVGKIETAQGKQHFWVGQQEFTLRIPGKFNVANACATIALARELGVTDEISVKALASYSGTWRRFELKGEYRKALVISDYAHHPTAITSTLKAAKEFYPGRRLVVVFQPHQRNRTEKLFEKFKLAFAVADFIIITEIFDVLGREQVLNPAASGQALAKAVEGQGKYCLYAQNLTKARSLLEEFLEKDDVVLIMGAGDIYKLADELVLS
ncbi:MAG: Mur ligase family protein, partial [Patescibacteria group bacterium]